MFRSRKQHWEVMGVAKEVFALGTSTHGDDVHGSQQVEHGKPNNGE